MSKRFQNLQKLQTLAAALLLLSAICSGQQPAATPPSQAADSSGSPAPLRVMVGKSLLINTTDHIIRVSVTDPEIADVLVVTGTQILVHGRAPGEVSLLIWDQSERSRSFDLRVDVDITAAAEELKQIFPDDKIEASASRGAFVISGYLTAQDRDQRADCRTGRLPGSDAGGAVCRGRSLRSNPTGSQLIRYGARQYRCHQ